MSYSRFIPTRAKGLNHFFFRLNGDCVKTRKIGANIPSVHRKPHNKVAQGAGQCLTSYWVIRPLGSTGSSHFRKIMSSSGVKVSDSGAMPPGTGRELAEQTVVGEK